MSAFTYGRTDLSNSPESALIEHNTYASFLYQARCVSANNR